MRIPNYKMSFWLLAVALLGVSVFDAWAVKMAVVDTEQVLKSSSEAQAVRETLEREVKARQDLIKVKQQKLQAKKEAFDKSSLAWSASKKLTERKKLEKEFIALQKLMRDSDRQMQQRQVELMQPILEKTLRIIRSIGGRKGFEIVYEKKSSGILYSKGAENITDLVSLELEKSSGSKKKKRSRK